MKVGNTLFWIPSTIAAIILLLVIWDFRGLSQGFPVLNDFPLAQLNAKAQNVTPANVIKIDLRDGTLHQPIKITADFPVLIG